jgi:hypothetical protein
MRTLYVEEKEEKEKALPPYYNMDTISKKILELEAYAEELYLII